MIATKFQLFIVSVSNSCKYRTRNNGLKTVKDGVGGFFAWPKNQVVLDEEVTPPTTIQKISDYNSAPKLQSKRKNYVSRETMQRQARTGKSHKSLNYGRVIPTTSVSRPQLKSNQLEDRVMHNNSPGKEQQVEDHRRNFKFSNNKMYVTACKDSLNAKTSNVYFVCVTCVKCVLNDNHDMCVLHYINGVNTKTKQPIAVPISTREPKQTVNQSIAAPLKKMVASKSTNQKPRSKIRKQYDHVIKT
ncbi:hypothetical protein Tco_0359956 [Tanacetum coccineum]